MDRRKPRTITKASNLVPKDGVGPKHFVTVDRDDTIVHAGALAVRGDRIAAVGPSHEVVARFPDAARVDGTGKVVMPGFANIHTHFTLIIAKGIYEDLSPPHKPPFT